jgi:hypothetical protein
MWPRFNKKIQAVPASIEQVKAGLILNCDLVFKTGSHRGFDAQTKFTRLNETI